MATVSYTDDLGTITDDSGTDLHDLWTEKTEGTVVTEQAFRQYSVARAVGID